MLPKIRSGVIGVALAGSRGQNALVGRALPSSRLGGPGITR